MKYLFIVVSCASVLFLNGCGLLIWYVAGYKAYSAQCTVDDSETNRQQVRQIVRRIADRYGFQDRTEEEKARDADLIRSGYTIIARYQASGSDKPSDNITLSVSSHKGELRTRLLQVKQGKSTLKYTEIQERLVSEFKESYGADVEVEVGYRRL
jgi:hypothetical protein